MAVWVRTLREPIRGISEGLVTKPHPAPFRVLTSELVAVIPPLNLITLKNDPRVLRNNAIGLVIIIIALIRYSL